MYNDLLERFKEIKGDNWDKDIFNNVSVTKLEELIKEVSIQTGELDEYMWYSMEEYYSDVLNVRYLMYEVYYGNVKPYDDYINSNEYGDLRSGTASKVAYFYEDNMQDIIYSIFESEYVTEYSNDFEETELFEYIYSELERYKDFEKLNHVAHNINNRYDSLIIERDFGKWLLLSIGGIDMVLVNQILNYYKSLQKVKPDCGLCELEDMFFKHNICVIKLNDILTVKYTSYQ